MPPARIELATPGLGNVRPTSPPAARTRRPPALGGFPLKVRVLARGLASPRVLRPGCGSRGGARPIPRPTENQGPDIAPIVPGGNAY